MTTWNLLYSAKRNKVKPVKSISRKELKEWCRNNRLSVDQILHHELIEQCRQFHIPDDDKRRSDLARTSMDHFGDRAVLVWISEWGVWQSVDRRDLFDAFCDERGLPNDLMDKSAYLFKRHEFADAAELVTICVRSLWDVHVVGARGKRYIYFSHDEIGGTSFATPEQFLKLLVTA